MIYVILGMHKSGTTLVSQILHHSGINMGDNIDPQVGYNQGNQYERKSTQMLNKAILDATGIYSLDITIPKTLRITEDQRTWMRKIIQDCNKRHASWGFKDPRTCLVYSLWASELSNHKIIVVYRSFEELWQHYYPRSIRLFFFVPYKVWNSIRHWCEYNVRILYYLQNTEMDFLVLDYQQLMTTQTELDRLQEFVGLKLEDRRRVDLYRNRPKRSFLVKMAVWLVYKQTGHHPEKILGRLNALRERGMVKQVSS